MYWDVMARVEVCIPYIKYHSLLLCLSSFRAQTERQMLFDLQNSPSDYLEYRFDGQTGATPLHVAAANGYLSVVEYLVCTDYGDGRRFGSTILI